MHLIYKWRKKYVFLTVRRHHTVRPLTTTKANTVLYMEQKQTHTRAQTSVENSRELSRVTGCETKRQSSALCTVCKIVGTPRGWLLCDRSRVEVHVAEQLLPRHRLRVEDVHREGHVELGVGLLQRVPQR
jgi:hypothetical protein